MGWATVALVVLAAGGASAVAGDSDAKAKRCRASQVRQTVRYRSGGHNRRATGCAPRFKAVPGSVAAALPLALARPRAFALKLTPKKVRRFRRARTAKRVLRASRVTDAALARRAAPAARAASVTSGSDSRSVDGPPGTRSTVKGSGTDWSAGESKVGRELKVVVDTKSTRLAGSDSAARKLVEFKYLMDRCPDAGGLGRGTVSYLQNDTLTVDTADGGRAITSTLGQFDGDVVAHFGEDARIASVELTGTWSWSTESRRGARPGGKTSRVSHHAVSGTIEAENVHGTRLDVKPTVTRATDDGTAIAGDYLGRFAAVMPDLDIEEMLDGIQARALGGVCVKVVPNEATVHVSPGSSTPIVAHVADSSGAPFSGAISTTNDKVTPQRADGSPDARFTYVAPATAPPGGTDFVRLDHTSHRGAADPGIVNVVYDSFDYRVLAARLDETITGEEPAPPGYGGCPPSGRETNTMELGPQPFDPANSDGHLFDDGADRTGQIEADGTSSITTVIHGCDVGQDPPASCSGTASLAADRAVTIEVTLPKAGGPAQIRWFFNQDPTAGTGLENHGTCLTELFHGHTDDASLGQRTVPRAVFESDGPQALSVDVQLDLPDEHGGTVHATEHYSLTIQRV
jgi:hypothetical protein